MDRGSYAKVAISCYRSLKIPRERHFYQVVREALSLFERDSASSSFKIEKIDVVFPVLHGPYGEDGCIQGTAEIAGVPYVGSSVFASAAAMDKEITKRLLRDAGFSIPRFSSFSIANIPPFENVVAELGTPVFVKPVRLGSSVGISKAFDADSFAAAARIAHRHCSRILVEEFVYGREIECGILQSPNGSLEISAPGELSVGTNHEFYTYEAKYKDTADIILTVPAMLPAAIIERIQTLSQEVFQLLGCSGLARIDFFLRPDGTLLINDNTMPGFTIASMYPRMFKAIGYPVAKLVDNLIRSALSKVRTV